MNDAPRADAVSLSTAEDTAGQVVLTGSDVDGDTLTYSLASQPEHGLASAEGNRATYTPAANYSGSDSFAFVVSDGKGESTGAVVSIHVAPVNDAPTSAGLSDAMPEDTPRALRLAGGDADGDSLTYEILDQPGRGTLSGSGADRTYTPAPNSSGPDWFTYAVSDGRLRSSVATVRLTVVPVNDAPSCASASLTTDEDIAVESAAICTDVDGDALTYSIVRAPSNGTASFVGGKLRYVPNRDVHGADSLTYRVSDPTLVSNVATATLIVNSINDAPVAASVDASLIEDGAADVTLLGTDVEGDSLSYEIVAGPASGTLTGAGASRTYTPVANFHGSDSFTYRVGDGVASSATATVTLSVESVNDAPTCAGVVLATDEDVAAERDPDCVDVDGDALTYSILGGAAKGTASVAAGKLRYVPDANANGADGFTYRAADGTSASAAAAVSVIVAPLNDAPVAEGAAVTASEDEAKALTLAASDLEGDLLEYEVVSGPEHGTLTGAGDARTYAPAPNYHGTDAFTFRARDGELASSVVTVSITVQPVNDAPVCGAQEMSLDEDASTAIEPACTDVDGDALTLKIVDQSAKGSAAVVAEKLRYVANPNANGADSFTYRAGDGALSSAVATVSVTIAPVNDAPTCADRTLATDEDVAAQLDPACSDIDGDALTYLVGEAAKGTAAIVADRLGYTPGADFNGSDSFTYTASDGGADSNVATVAVTVVAVNDAPTATDQTATMAEDTEKALILGADDVDGDPVTYEIVAGPADGTLAGEGAERVYTPAANFNGSDSFTYRASDGVAASGIATVTLSVESVNDAPTCAAVALATDEDVAAERDPDCFDVEGDALTYSIVEAATKGTASVDAGRLRYVPDANANGEDGFTYRAADGNAQSEVASVGVIVDSVNDAPSSASQEATTSEDTPKALMLSGADIDGDALSYEIVSAPENGVLSGSGADRTYTPAEHYHGPDSFTFKVSDGAAESEVATVTLAVESVNDAPTASDLAAATAEDTAKALTLDVGDVDGDPLAFEIVSGPAHGDLSGTGAERTYTPHPDYNGADQFTYTVGDGSASSTVATVSVTVTEVNDSPSAAADAQQTTEDTELVVSAASLLENDGTGPPNEAPQSLTLTGVGSAVGGTVAYEAAAGEIRFAPDQHFHGTASFAYAIEDDGQTDGAADPKAAEGTVTIDVASVNDEPVASAGEQTTNEDEAVGFALAAADADGDALQFTIDAQPLHGEVALAGDQVTYTSAANYHGPDSFTFVASDGSSSSSAAILIDVVSINDAPALDTSGNPQLSPVKQDASEPAGDTVAEILASGAAGDQIVADVDGDLSGIAVVSVDESGGAWEYQTAGGSWASLEGADASAARLLDLDSKLRFVPTVGFSGEATLRFRAWDQSVGTVGGTADATGTGGSSAFSADDEEAAITVIPNVPPVAADDTATTTEDNDVTIDLLANDSDADGEPLTLAVETQPDAGSATLVDGGIQYRPDPDKNGTDRFTYTVRDPRGGVATGTVDVTITAVNDSPITQNDTEIVAEDGIVVVDPTGNDTAGPLDESGGALSLGTITAPAQHGTAAVTGGKIRYTPTPGFTGSDLLTYEVCDGGTPVLCGEANVTLTVSRVSATAETDPVPHLPEHNPNGSVKVIDAADDPAIWVNPVDPAQSLVIGTSKFSDTSNGGLFVYDLDGNQLSYTNDGTKNNVDLRSGFPLGGREVTLVTASQRNDPPQPKRVAIYTLDPSTKSLALAGEFTPLFEPLGDCMYRSATTGHFYVFVVSANGYVQQWRLAEAPGGTGAINATEVRLFRVSAVGAPDIVEGCVADDELGHFYVSEEEVGIWRYSAEPDGGEARMQVDAVGGGQLTADVEGLTIAYGPGGTGYLIASSQGSNSFAVYRRGGDNAFVRSFKIKDGAVDGTTITDGIDVTTASLGPAFPNGMFVAQDNNNTPDNQNFKLVPLERIFPIAAAGSNPETAGAGAAALFAGVIWLGLAAIRRRRRRLPSSEG